MAVPYTFGTATSAIPLSQLDSNFATAITIGNTAVYLGNTTTSFGNVTLTNVTISSVASTFPNSYLSNSTATLGNATITLGGTTTSVGNLTLTNANIASGTVTITDITASGNVTLSGGTANGVAYLNGSKVVTTGSALTFDGTNFATTGRVTSGTGVFAGTNIILGNNGTQSNLYLDGGYGTYLTASINRGPIQFYVSDSEQMRLTSTGLGIGTSSPSAKLQVANGNILLSNAYYLSARNNANTLSLNLIGRNTSDQVVIDADGYGTLIGAGGALNLNSSGNLGLGVSSPLQLFHARKDQAAYTWARVDNQSSSASAYSGWMLGAFGNTWGMAIGSSAANSNALTWILDAGGSNSEKMRLDSSGNLGLGVTPSAWTTYKAFQFGNTASLVGANSFNILSNNWYYDGADRYIVTGQAVSQYYQNSGQHVWRNAPSGTAGNAITFTQAMTLDASGNLGVGTTSPAVKLDVNGACNFGGSSGVRAGVGTAFVVGQAELYAQGAVQLGVGTAGAQPLNFYTNSTERARITSGGNFLIGTTAFPSASVAGLGMNGQSSGNASSSGSSTAAYNHWLFYNGNGIVGYISTSGSLTTYSTVSDQRLKQNIVDADNASSLIDALQVRQFDWKADGNHQRYGFVAQELVTIAPEAVHQPADPEEMMAVDYSKLVPMLVKEIQSLRKRLADAGIA